MNYSISTIWSPFSSPFTNTKLLNDQDFSKNEITISNFSMKWFTKMPYKRQQKMVNKCPFLPFFHLNPGKRQIKSRCCRNMCPLGLMRHQYRERRVVHCVIRFPKCIAAKKMNNNIRPFMYISQCRQHFVTKIVHCNLFAIMYYVHAACEGNLNLVSV